MTPREIEAAKRAATRAAKFLGDFPVRDLSRSAEIMRSATRQPGFTFAADAARLTAEVVGSPSWQKVIAPTLTELNRHSAAVARLGMVRPEMLDSIRQPVIQAFAGSWVKFMSEDLQEIARTAAKIQADILQDFPSRVLAGLNLHKFEIPAIRLPPPPKPGTLLGDLLILEWNHSNETEKTAALDRLVSRLGWKPRGAAVRHGLLVREVLERQPRRDIVRDVLRTAFLLALGQQDQPQMHRFGPNWYTDKTGRRAAFVPNELPVPLFWRWLCDEARTAANRILLELPYPEAERAYERARTFGLTRLACADRVADTDPLPEQLLVRREEMLLASFALDAVLGRATGGQKKVILALYVEQQTNPEATLADAAARLGISSSTARVQLHLLRERLGLDRRCTLNAFLATLPPRPPFPR